MRVIYERIINQVMRISKGKVFYFDTQGTYQCVSLKEAKGMDFSNLHIRGNGTVYFDSDYKKLVEPSTNYHLIRMAIARLKKGDTIKEFEYHLAHVEIKTIPKPEGLDRFITRIEPPVFIRVPENPKEETFDYIYIEVNIVIEWEQDKKQYIRENMKEINRRVIEKIKSDKKFKKYGLPISFLKIGRITLENARTLEYVFEIKEV